MPAPGNAFNTQALDRLIVALDFPTAAEARDLAQRLRGTCKWVKIGLELYVAAGNAVVQELANLGFSIFLDLKFHDIPNTVAGAVRSAARSQASLLTLHAAGGPAMLAAAVQAARIANNPPQLLAVTVLTSIDVAQLAATGVSAAPADQVLRLARMAQAAGIPGLVCSAEEVRMLRQQLGPDMRLVVPGIRPAGTESGDQKRVATPGGAIRAGADMLVVGRPITQAPDPEEAAKAILAEIAEAIAV